MVRHESEFILPDFKDEIFAFHVVRYIWAMTYAFGGEVLDAGCGSGYGTYMLSTIANKVVGIDVNEDAIIYAKKRYKAKNLEFKCVNVINVDKSIREKFDLVTCFEVLEHIEPQECDRFLSSIRDVLKEGGKLILSTPNPLVEVAFLKSVGQEPAHYHKNYMEPDKLKSKLLEYFPQVKLFGQRMKSGLLKRMLKSIDYFNLRHVILRGKVKEWLINRAVNLKASVDLSSIEINDDMIRQSGIIVALCMK
jgi:2-polyprenyl-3-methyl-5-hydroxy-6-metoxy-1,4-benzoquinol methylase